MNTRHDHALGRLLGLALLFVGLAGCATYGSTKAPTPPAVLREGESLWRRIETDHFVIESNLQNTSLIKGVARDFETLWEALAAVPLLGLNPPTTKPLVVVLQNDGEYYHLADVDTAGLFYHQTRLGPMILIPAESRAFGERVIKHELAHFLSSEYLPRNLTWLDEGIAQVLETAIYNARDGVVRFGQANIGLVHYAGSDIPAEVFLAPWPTEFEGDLRSQYYGRSWLLVHYLVDNELQAFLNFLVRLSIGEEWRSAWEREIQLPLSSVDIALEHYLARQDFAEWIVRTKSNDTERLELSQVPPADALALAAALEAYAPTSERSMEEKLDRANAILEEAWSLDPSSARVQLLMQQREEAP